MVYFMESNDRTTPEEANKRAKVAGPSKPEVNPEQPAKVSARSMSEASFRSLQRKIAALEEEAKEREVASILTSMVVIISQRENSTHNEVLESAPTDVAEDLPTGSSGSGTMKPTSPAIEDTTKRKLRPRKEDGSCRAALPVATKMSSKVPKHGANKAPNMQYYYNQFRARVVVLVGIQEIKAFQTGTFQANVSSLWKRLRAEEQVAFGGRSEAEQRSMLQKIMHPPEDKSKRETLKKSQRKMEVAQSPRPGLRRNTVRSKKSERPGRPAPWFTYLSHN